MQPGCIKPLKTNLTSQRPRIIIGKSICPLKRSLVHTESVFIANTESVILDLNSLGMIKEQVGLFFFIKFQNLRMKKTFLCQSGATTLLAEITGESTYLDDLSSFCENYR